MTPRRKAPARVLLRRLASLALAALLLCALGPGPLCCAEAAAASGPASATPNTSPSASPQAAPKAKKAKPAAAKSTSGTVAKANTAARPATPGKAAKQGKAAAPGTKDAPDASKLSAEDLQAPYAALGPQDNATRLFPEPAPTGRPFAAPEPELPLSLRLGREQLRDPLTGKDISPKADPEKAKESLKNMDLKGAMDKLGGKAEVQVEILKF